MPEFYDNFFFLGGGGTPPVLISYAYVSGPPTSVLVMVPRCISHGAPVY